MFKLTVTINALRSMATTKETEMISVIGTRERAHKELDKALDAMDVPSVPEESPGE